MPLLFGLLVGTYSPLTDLHQVSVPAAGGPEISVRPCKPGTACAATSKPRRGPWRQAHRPRPCQPRVPHPPGGTAGRTCGLRQLIQRSSAAHNVACKKAGSPLRRRGTKRPGCAAHLPCMAECSPAKMVMQVRRACARATATGSVVRRAAFQHAARLCTLCVRMHACITKRAHATARLH